jgi:eukaryotic-like serine/threonine-protein kinase
VYKARDTRLNRTVAIKMLSSHLSDNAEVKTRFEREAQTIAGLNPSTHLRAVPGGQGAAPSHNRSSENDR